MRRRQPATARRRVGISRSSWRWRSMRIPHDRKSRPRRRSSANHEPRRLMSSRREAFCRLNRPHPWRQFADTPLYSGGELTRPCLCEASFTSNHATQRQVEASASEEPTHANLWGYNEPIRSAYVRTEVNKMMTRFVRLSMRESTRRRVDTRHIPVTTRKHKSSSPITTQLSTHNPGLTQFW